ncbi:MAG: enoyl-CoA hydratase-related protein [Burkholderiales bacterium]|nr:enoyl-CoA hydratase-related protein [Burkholderiales bacterium]
MSAVLLETDRRGVATVTLNRPEVNNAYDGALIEGLLEAFARIAGDPAVRVVVLRGAGRHFQAGADLKWIAETSRRDERANLEVSRRTATAMRGLNELAKPTIALVQGACIGGGTGLVASCDVVIAERTATFAISEARWGLTAAIIFPQLVAAIGLRQVRRYALTCERISAERAQAIGLVHELCEPGALDSAAAPVIEGLLKAGPEALAESKRSAMRVAGALVSDAEFERLVAEHAAKRRSAEAAEGLESFAERREARWYPG